MEYKETINNKNDIFTQVSDIDLDFLPDVSITPEIDQNDFSVSSIILFDAKDSENDDTITIIKLQQEIADLKFELEEQEKMFQLQNLQINFLKNEVKKNEREESAHNKILEDNEAIQMLVKLITMTPKLSSEGEEIISKILKIINISDFDLIKILKFRKTKHQRSKTSLFCRFA
ncbi:unnamed protein product [Blepharisma stoltei]|uniref:GRIP domain-containing protein n=1 Tax=Blepharisma stoltei TaxID=1481888 RepID=A0AAU9JR52_9CILI|nr:unnamed protein product [Blepharisma stoltei]